MRRKRSSKWADICMIAIAKISLPGIACTNTTVNLDFRFDDWKRAVETVELTKCCGLKTDGRLGTENHLLISSLSRKPNGKCRAIAFS